MSATAVGSEHNATCHGGELQQRLCRHLNDDTSLQAGPVVFDGDWAVLSFHGTHSELCGL